MSLKDIEQKSWAIMIAGLMVGVGIASGQLVPWWVQRQEAEKANSAKLEVELKKKNVADAEKRLALNAWSEIQKTLAKLIEKYPSLIELKNNRGYTPAYCIKDIFTHNDSLEDALADDILSSLNNSNLGVTFGYDNLLWMRQGEFMKYVDIPSSCDMPVALHRKNRYWQPPK